MRFPIFGVVATLLATAVSEAAAATKHNLRPSSQRSPGLCLTRHCSGQLWQCVRDPQCRQCTDCMRQCSVQDMLCTTRCFFLYAERPFNQLTQCGLDHECFPPLTWSNTTCPAHKMQKHTAPFPLRSFADAGEMVVVRGSHPIYDCLPCQRLQFRPADSNTNEDGDVQTRWSTAIEGTVRSASYLLRQQQPGQIVTQYELFGMPVQEHYYILDFTQDGKFVLYVYCGFGYGGEYQGALVYGARSAAGTLAGVDLPADVEQQFAASLLKAGLQKYLPPWNQFCTPKYEGVPGGCPNLVD